MSATERLRELLDERGVEWDGESYEGVTFWNEETNLAVASDGADGELWVSQSITPEEAITATLGSGTCHLVPYNENYATCSECGISLPRFHGGWWFYCPGCGRHLMGEKVVDE